MSMRERQGLIARVRHLRRVGAARETPSTAAKTEAEPARVGVLEVRIQELEQLVEGLQDSVHREAQRQDDRIADLEARIEPSALGAALSKDARERGL